MEEYYDGINEQIDEIAEHILILGGQPLGTMKDYLANSDIAEANNEKVKDTLVFQNVVNDLEKLLGEVVKIKEEADKNNEYSTSSLMDEYILDYSKKLWMLKQMMING